MSTKYPGGFITKSPVAPTTTAASGIWTLDQQQQAQKAGTWPSPPIFIEDLFSTYLVTGDGTAPAVNNGIDVSGQGGLVWIKKRSAAGSHSLFDTARGANLRLISNDTAAQDSVNLSFTSTGFSNYTFDSAVTYASWTFREQPKFFDVVTWTGNGSARTIAHNLGSTPGCIIIKCLNTTFDWIVWHRSFPANNYNAFLNTTDAAAAYGVTSSTAPTDTVFSLTTSSYTNQNGSTYVAYLFAHDAGGFPVSGGGSTNGISCGTYTGTGSPLDVTLGYEPQWLLVKKTSATGDWILMDTMRGMSMTTSQWLYPNTSGIEDASGTQLNPTATGFTVTSSGSGLNGGGATYIYIAIRRGPMKTPTVGTSVYNAIARTGTGATATVTGVGFTPDMLIDTNRTKALTNQNYLTDRLRGLVKFQTDSTDGENSWNATSFLGFTMDGMNVGADGGGYINGVTPYINWFFKRAPGFFDEVCYTGTGVIGLQVTHNLTVAPELLIVKRRNSTGEWDVYCSALGATKVLELNSTGASFTADHWNNTTPTSTYFTLYDYGNINASGGTYVAYLFATVAGVSKVGSYTGTGAAQTINCGFTAGSRFVLIKRTDSTGDWYVWDSARGIIPANDPYLLLNSTAAEVTGTDYVDTTNVGFDITSTAPAGINANGGTFIFLAIA
jgi:hypothetical protein